MGVSLKSTYVITYGDMKPFSPASTLKMAVAFNKKLKKNSNDSTARVAHAKEMYHVTKLVSAKRNCCTVRVSTRCR